MIPAVVSASVQNCSIHGSKLMGVGVTGVKYFRSHCDPRCCQCLCPKLIGMGFMGSNILDLIPEHFGSHSDPSCCQCLCPKLLYLGIKIDGRGSHGLKYWIVYRAVWLAPRPALEACEKVYTALHSGRFNQYCLQPFLDSNKALYCIRSFGSYPALIVLPKM